MIRGIILNKKLRLLKSTLYSLKGIKIKAATKNGTNLIKGISETCKKGIISISVFSFSSAMFTIRKYTQENWNILYALSLFINFQTIFRYYVCNKFNTYLIQAGSFNTPDIKTRIAPHGPEYCNMP